MSQTPVTVTYSLEEILQQINQKLDRLDEKFEAKLDDLQKDVTDIKIGQVKLEGKLETLETELKGKIDKLDAELTGRIDKLDAKLTGEIKTLEAEVKGISKRLDTQEFINRSVVVGFVLAILAGTVMLFFPNFPS